MSRRMIYKFDQAVTAALGSNGRYVAMIGMTASAVLFSFHYKFKEVIQATENVADIQSPSTLFYLRLLFGRTRSRLMGSLMNQPVRPVLREPLYNALARIGGIDLDETRYPLRSYKCIGHLFARTLKDKEREIEDIGPDSLASPADGVVMVVGDVKSERVEQVKGATYSLRAFLGLMPTVTDPQKNSDVFSVNERVVMSGKWAYGCMHMVAVAAYNVGNIRIAKEPDLRTNELRVVLRHLGGDVETRNYSEPPVEYAVGQHVGEFRLGSTIALIFEAPRDFEWNVVSHQHEERMKTAPGDEVRVGKRLGGVGPVKRAQTNTERLYAFY
ncbi:phosphatidylserine decarboxylase [Cystoisospora suis]|uniref:Phosphatidylserine decarboxylase n=1 Tax=Cystoisospora suis TaxID=483139 RepID=A0A2C6KZ35_9APIC|nr:phosphatidylserine decarboxylase [Cystoisospora suis]